MSESSESDTEDITNEPVSVTEQEIDTSLGGVHRLVPSEINEDQRFEPISMDQKKSRYVLKTGDTIRYKENEDHSWTDATVIGPAGSARGANKNWYNIQQESGKDLSVNIEALHQVEKKLPTDTFICEKAESGVYFNKCPSDKTLELIKAAKHREMENFNKYKVFEEIAENKCEDHVPCVSSRWIVNTKQDGQVKQD